MEVAETFSQALAEKVREHRRRSGLTQQALAQHAGVGKTVIYDIEHGKSSVRLNTLLKVLHVLNIKVRLESPLTSGDVHDA